MDNSKKLFVVIPAYNEATTIFDVVSKVIQIIQNVIVVDDASNDNTVELAEKAGADVVSHLINRGQGATLKTGIDYALSRGADVIVTFDADGQHHIDDLTPLIEPILSQQCEVTLGSRYLTELSKKHVPLMRKVLHKLAIGYTNISTGLRLSDTHNGLRAMTAEAAKKIKFQQDRMAHASEILEEIAHKRISYKEVPVTIHYTEYSLAKGQKLEDFIIILFKIFIDKLK